MRTMHRRDMGSTRGKSRESQNDIKKLRKENEQLRREIWSLRDEYDKLEEILKHQKSREGSEEYEKRSDEDEVSYSDYSDEEDEVDNQEENEEQEEQEEQLENAENQKISTEKMNSSLHRLHVDFDDLSVVDEEEELRKDKDRKEAAGPDDSRALKDPGKSDQTRDKVQDGFSYFSTPYDSRSDTLSGSGQNYYSECPFVFPNPNDANYPKMLPMDNPTLLMSPCARVYSGPLTPLPSLEAAGLGSVSPIFGPGDHAIGHSQLPIRNPPIGWENSVVKTGTAGNRFQGSIPVGQTSGAAATLNLSNGQSLSSSGVSADGSLGTRSQSLQRSFMRQETAFPSPAGNNVYENYTGSFSGASSQRRNVPLKQPVEYLGEGSQDTATMGLSSGEAFLRSERDFGRGMLVHREEESKTDKMTSKENTENSMNLNQEGVEKKMSEASTLPMSERPKHFFAPLSSKLKMHQSDEGKASEDSPQSASKLFGTAYSSSSDNTCSTVVSRNRYLGKKGSADIYVNGAFPVGNSPTDRNEERSFLSTENFLLEDPRNMSRQSSSNALVKSLSCQDLSSDPQNIPFAEKLRIFDGDGKGQKLTKSDNTLDASSNASKPFRSQLNVTLKLPRMNLPPSPETPEIPKLPTIDYRLFSNPFLRDFEQSSSNYANLGYQCPVTRPLSIQVNENGYNRLNGNSNYSNPIVTQPPNQPGDLEGDYCRIRGLGRTEEQRLLMATNQPRDNRMTSSTKAQDYQVTSFEGPNPHTLLPPLKPFDRLPTPNPILQNQLLYQNLPVLPKVPTIFGQGVMTSSMMNRMWNYDPIATKVPAQTQTSIDGDSQKEDLEVCKNVKSPEPENTSQPSSPTTLRRRKTLRKDRSTSVKDKRPLSPAAQRRRERLRKQSSVTSSEVPDSPQKSSQKSRNLSLSTTTTSEQQDKNESRSSSSGQDSPKKDQTRRVSIYFNAKKRSSLSSVKTHRSGSLDNSKDRYLTRADTLDGTTTNSERERTNSVSSRETIAKGRKMSTSSGKVPWCACWGNGCI
ncbi:uncharacterized protein LOC107267292 isoform X2 [Cephus cinctus]|uniref:Uncharacterized protein LOC107267292 isoform X2 n=1 Tax=Cephus cinctus TaxID=211228 RepID=A0AAJ7BV45_CEPCN|nr:uncharacterized protein LOC107267292 isoform X2 [Cephus cinctus]